MAQKILTIVDGSKAGKSACSYASYLASKNKINITGMAIFDVPWITSARLDPLGGVAYRLYHDEEIIEGSHNEIENLLEDFKHSAKEAGIKANCIEVNGYPIDEIERVANEHDLIVMGRTTDFRFQLDDDNDDVVTKVVRDNPRPVVVIPEDYTKGEIPLVAYDGTCESARALHMFLLLNIYKGQEIHIITVRHKMESAEKIISQAVNMCQAYGLTAHKHCFASYSEPSKLILKQARELNPSMVIMGTANTSAITEVLFGSCTLNLLRKSSWPVFVHH